MKNEVPQEIANKLIELGNRDNLNEPFIVADFEQFRPYEHLGRIHWREWNSVCEGLSIEEHISLLKAVVMTMRYSGWDGGSVAPGIWVFKKLEERIPNKQAAEIAKWVIEHSDNPWMPFGNQRDRALFIANQDIDNPVREKYPTMANKNASLQKVKTTGNSNLHSSRTGKTDEFYTQISLIEKELRHYKEFFRGKTVFCNCDDPEESNFWQYFKLNFEQLKLKKLISTHYETTTPSYKLEITGDTNRDGKINALDIVRTPLRQNGDFRSPECKEIMESADVIVTNPPFSLFREYFAQIMEQGKHFLIIGNQNAITYREIFLLIRDNKIWLGYNSGHFWFRVPADYEVKKTDFKIDEEGMKWRRMGNICWFTNIDIEKRHENMTLFRNYTPDKYPKYDNYDAINVDRTVDIPCDYFGVMGVPITFMQYHNPSQFEIVGSDFEVKDGILPQIVNPKWVGKTDRGYLNGRRLYSRLLIRRLNP